MLERVARALCKEDGKDWNEINDWGKCNYHDLARAAIEAMREPTKAMIDYAYEAMEHDSPDESYRNMIDAALTSRPKGE